MNRPRHLLFSLDYPPLTGGVANFLSQRIDNREGIDIAVLTVAGDHPSVRPGARPTAVETIRFRPRFGNTRIINRVFQYSQGFFHLLKRQIAEPFDVLESGTALPGSFYGWTLKKFSAIKTVTFVHGNDLLRPQKIFPASWMLKAGLVSSDLIVANSNFTANLVQAIGVNRERIVVINPSVDTNRFNPETPSDFVRSRHNLGDRKVLMTVSRLYLGRKGFSTLFETVRLLKQSRDDISLLVVGSGDARAELESLVAEKGLTNEIVFAGYVDDEELPAYYCAADIFVMVSDLDLEKGDVEGYGIVYDEAHGCETPCIAADTGGAPEAVTHEEDGLVVPAADSAALACAVERILADEDFCRSLGKNGRQRLVAKDYSWSVLNNLSM